jgi:hypothetical protein
LKTEQRLQQKVLRYAEAEIRSILIGHGSALFHYHQLIIMLNGYVHCDIISQREADAIAGDAKMALDNSLRH